MIIGVVSSVNQPSAADGALAGVMSSVGVSQAQKRHAFRDEQVFRRQAKRDAALAVAIIEALGEHARRGGTAIGAAAVAKRVAMDMGVNVSRVSVPRLTRAERESLNWASQ